MSSALRTHRKSIDWCFRHDRLSVRAAALDMGNESMIRPTLVPHPKLSRFISSSETHMHTRLPLCLCGARLPQISRRARDRRSRGGGLSLSASQTARRRAKVSLILFWRQIRVSSSEKLRDRSSFDPHVFLTAEASAKRTIAYLGFHRAPEIECRESWCGERVPCGLLSFVIIIDTLYLSRLQIDKEIVAKCRYRKSTRS